MVSSPFRAQAEHIYAHRAGAISTSFVLLDNAALWLERAHGEQQQPIVALLTDSAHPALEHFEGAANAVADGLVLLRGSASGANARALRETLTWLRPAPLGLNTSAGFGDRLGLATPGHVRALRRVAEDMPDAPVAPIFAQQSVRENARTGHTPQEVLDDATWGAFTAGWRGPVGADADHIKTTEDIDAFASAGYTFYTFDPGAYVDATDHTAPDELLAIFSALPWERLETTPDDAVRRYAAHAVDLETQSLQFSEDTVVRAAAKYGRAIAHVVTLHRHLAGKGVPFEVEVSVDETETPTTPAEHIFIAGELRRLGVTCVSLAPRYIGRFEKGIDYIGDLQALAGDFATHAEIARTFGPYKLSLHSGSDKFSVYGIFTEAARGMLHLKTAGTSYVEALRLIARVAPDLFRQVLAMARDAYEHDAASYHVSADVSRIPLSPADDQLVALLDDTNARQVLHVTFGSVLAAVRTPLLATLREHEDLYEQTLEMHFVRHLEPLLAYGRK